MFLCVREGVGRWVGGVGDFNGVLGILGDLGESGLYSPFGPTPIQDSIV